MSPLHRRFSKHWLKALCLLLIIVSGVQCIFNVSHVLQMFLIVVQHHLTLCFLLLLPFLSLISSEGVIAYYWSKFDIPINNLEVVPQFSEMRVLAALEAGIKAQRNMAPAELKIREVTVSREYQEQVEGHFKGQKL